MSKQQPLVVFRSQERGPDKPRVGSPNDVQVGDWLTFFADQAFSGRLVASIHKSYVLTKPLMSLQGKLLEPPIKVPYENFYRAFREDPNAEPEPEPELEPEPEPEPPPPKLKKSRKKPPPGLAAFVDKRYK